MARIAGINIPNHQHTAIALTAIYGIGRARARQICEGLIEPAQAVEDISAIRERRREVRDDHGRASLPPRFRPFEGENARCVDYGHRSKSAPLSAILCPRFEERGADLGVEHHVWPPS